MSSSSCTATTTPLARKICRWVTSNSSGRRGLAHLKSGILLLPVYHWTPHRIFAHFSLSVLSFLLELLTEHHCNDTWRNIRDDLKQIKLSLFFISNFIFFHVTYPHKNSSNRLKSLKIKKLPPILLIFLKPRYTPITLYGHISLYLLNNMYRLIKGKNIMATESTEEHGKINPFR